MSFSSLSMIVFSISLSFNPLGTKEKKKMPLDFLSELWIKAVFFTIF